LDESSKLNPLKVIHEINLMKKKINILFVVLGLCSIIAFIYAVTFTYNLREIRINGELKKCRIVRISYAIKGGNHAYIMIEGKELPAGVLISKVKVGDSLLVRYIKDKPWVVQDRVKLWRYYLFFSLESILLIVGVILTVGGFLGKER